MYSNYINQRDTYKLVEKITGKKFSSEIALLKSLVRDIVNLPDFEITGGRIWELIPEDNSYQLRYQYGNVKKIPNDYKISISEQPVLKKLFQQRTSLFYETDALLQEMGIELYSVTGVGEIIRLRNGKFYKYALGFNAPEILQSFFETLTIISGVASIALRNFSTQAEQKKIRQDLVKASEIQKNLLPEHKLSYLDYNIFGVCHSANEVGGDFYDYIKVSDVQDEHLAVVICDAASKGLPASIQALFVYGAIRMGMSFSTRISHLLARINTLIFDTFPYERFVTLFYCDLTPSSNRLVLYANAGHCQPIHYRPSTDQIRILETTGGLMGLVREQKFGVENINMHPGDILVLYTDGISEARDKEGNLYSEERLADLIRNTFSKSSEDIAYAIIEDVQKFSAGSDYTDDQTLVVIKRDETKQ